MSIKRSKLAEKKPTIKLRRAPDRENEKQGKKQKPAVVAVAALQQLAEANTENRVLPPNFRILQMLGTGAMGTVYRVTDETTGQELAAKVLNPQWNSDRIALKRFEIEAAAAGELNHPNIAQVYSCYADNKTAFLLMEYVDGQSLAQILHRDRVVETGKMINLLLQICDALDYAHGRGVVHRDLKPSNIIVRELPTGNVAKLVDFGIAKVAPTNKSATQLTQMGQVFGTPSYMSPEQAHGGNTDHRSDLYALGCILYEALAGKQLFSGENGIHVMLQHINVSPQKATRALLQKGYSKSFVAVLEKLLEKKPDRRYQSANELGDDLQRIVQKKSSKAFLRNPLMINVSRNTIVACAAGISLISVVAIAVYGLSNSPKHSGDGVSMTASEKLRADQTEEKQLIGKLCNGDAQEVAFAVKALVRLTGSWSILHNAIGGAGHYSNDRDNDLISAADQDVIMRAFQRSADGPLREQLLAILGTTVKPTKASMELIASVSQQKEGSQQRAVAREVLKLYAERISPEQELWLSTIASRILMRDPEACPYVSDLANAIHKFSDEAISNFRSSANSMSTDELSKRVGYGPTSDYPLLRASAVRKEYYPELLVLAHRLKNPISAWVALERLGAKACPAIPSLCRMLENSDDETRTAQALGSIGPLAAPKAVPLLKKLLYTPADKVSGVAENQQESLNYNKQAAAAMALAKMGPSGEAVLQEAARSKDKIGELSTKSLQKLKQEKEFPTNKIPTLENYNRYGTIGPDYE